MNILVVEDNTDILETYQAYFKEFNRTHGVNEPTYVYSYASATAALDAETAFDVVIVDLGIPEYDDGPVDLDNLLGVELVDILAMREHRPIPAVLVVTGNLGNTNRQLHIQNTLQSGFYYGRAINKKEDYKAEILSCIDRAVHYREMEIQYNGQETEAPISLTPREEDLLRRAILEQDAVTGLIIKRWGLDFGLRRSERPDDPKVLYGRFILENDRGRSTPSFFKFEKKDYHLNSVRSARLIRQMVSYVPLVATPRFGRDRGLLVTMQAGRSSRDQISITDVLRQSERDISSALTKVAGQISSQINDLGNPTQENIRLKDIISRWHSRANLADAWKLHQVTPKNIYGPAAIHSAIMDHERIVHVAYQGFSHGDLHFGNIAVEAVDNGYEAFIFDPGVMEKSPCGRDLAGLEVSLLLHQRYEGPSLVSYCRNLYDGMGEEYEIPAAPSSSVHLNNYLLLSSLRREALKHCSVETYILCVFDYLLIQLGGLTTEYSQNKIFSRADVYKLYEYLEPWLISLFDLKVKQKDNVPS